MVVLGTTVYIVMHTRPRTSSRSTSGQDKPEVITQQKQYGPMSHPALINESQSDNSKNKIWAKPAEYAQGTRAIGRGEGVSSLEDSLG